jgi:hypothetical protein
VEFLSQTATGIIDIRLDPPTRNPPRQINLRARHPEGFAMKSVLVNGLPYAGFDANAEIITLHELNQTVHVRVLY